MDLLSTYQELIKIAERLGYEVRESRMDEDISSSGEKYILRDRRYILLNTSSKIENRVESLVKILKSEDLDPLHITPFLREKYFPNG
jgi:hypothetical protein